ncbi:MAG: hypothetical protein PUK67_06310 [Prevotellaceae bacterium]|nr:hypothetical protein [Prevotellaceae bacterium]MDY3366229.1 hypothetical protein [Prevotella sp.]
MSIILTDNVEIAQFLKIVFERLPSVINRWFDLLNDEQYVLLVPIHHTSGIHDADLVENTGKKSIIQTVKNWLVKLKSL